MDINFIPAIIVLCVILLDVVSGVVKGASTQTLSSSIMREGMWHKASEILLEVLAIGAAICVSVWTDLPDYLDGVYYAISVYLITMESISILENICVANPELKIGKLLRIFGLNKEDKEGDDDVA